MEKLVEMTKMLCTSLQQQQQQHLELQQQHQELQQQILQQQKSLETILKQSTGERKNTVFSAEGIANSLSEFIYEPDSGITFPAYFKRFETIFTKRCQHWSDEERVTLLVQKLGTNENTKYSNLILPRKPEEVSFEETISILSKIFDERNSLFHTRYRCLNIVKADNEDFLAYAGTVNSLVEQFKLEEISKDVFKCLIFLQGLTDPKYKEIRSRILIMVEQDSNITLQRVTEECQRLINVKRDNTQIEEKSVANVRHVKTQKSQKDRKM